MCIKKQNWKFITYSRSIYDGWLDSPPIPRATSSTFHSHPIHANRRPTALHATPSARATVPREFLPIGRRHVIRWTACTPGSQPVTLAHGFWRSLFLENTPPRTVLKNSANRGATVQKNHHIPYLSSLLHASRGRRRCRRGAPPCRSSSDESKPMAGSAVLSSPSSPRTTCRGVACTPGSPLPRSPLAATNELAAGGSGDQTVRRAACSPPLRSLSHIRPAPGPRASASSTAPACAAAPPPADVTP